MKIFRSLPPLAGFLLSASSLPGVAGDPVPFGGVLEIGTGRSVINARDVGGGNWTPYYFLTGSDLGQTITANCQDRRGCDLFGEIRRLDKLPEGATDAYQILSVVQAKAAVPGLTVEENLALTPDAALTEQQRAEARTASEILARQLGERNFYGLPPDCLDLRPTAHDSPVYTIDVHTKPCALTDLTVLLGRWRVNVTDGSAAVATRDGQYRPL